MVPAPILVVDPTGFGIGKYDTDVDVGAGINKIATQYALPEMLLFSGASGLTM